METLQRARGLAQARAKSHTPAHTSRARDGDGGQKSKRKGCPPNYRLKGTIKNAAKPQGATKTKGAGGRARGYVSASYGRTCAHRGQLAETKVPFRGMNTAKQGGRALTSYTQRGHATAKIPRNKKYHSLNNFFQKSYKKRLTNSMN